MPLRSDPAYDDVQIFEVDIGDDAPSLTHSELLARITGRKSTPQADPISPAELAKALSIRLAPTIQFLGSAGIVAPALVGYSGPDFYWAYLSDRIAGARESMEMHRLGRDVVR